METNGIIERKLRLLEGKIADIKEWEIVQFNSFKKSSLQKNAVERALTVCVEIMIDVSERILSIKQLPPCDSSVESFKSLEKLNAIKSYAKYADMVRFRNFVVHRYEDIDPQILFDIITRRLDDFLAFADEIRRFCIKK